jgi:hypothetical protein
MFLSSSSITATNQLTPLEWANVSWSSKCISEFTLQLVKKFYDIQNILLACFDTQSISVEY